MLLSTLDIDIFKAKAAVGEIREWKGIKYQKKANGQWIPLKGQGKQRAPRFDENKYGTNYSQFENDPKGALEFLFKKRQGQVIGAYKREGLGLIDIIWGNDRSGLQHIEKRHLVEQDDFQSIQEITETLSSAIKNGKIGRFYEGGSKVDLYKGRFKIVLTKEVIYDEEDNFRDKIWILTSYDNSRKKEDKIIKKGFDCTYPGNSVFQLVLDLGESENNSSHFGSINPFLKSEGWTSTTHTPSDSLEKSSDLHACLVDSTIIASDTDKAQTDIEFGSESSVSGHKDTMSVSLVQQLDPNIFEKARQGASIGTIKEFGGKKYIKTESSWKYQGKKKGQAEEETSSTKENEVEDESKKKSSKLDEFASKASEKQLEQAMKDPNQKDEVKEIAKKELEKRKGDGNKEYKRKAQ